MPKTHDLRQTMVREVQLGKLIEDADLYPRASVNAAVVHQYQDALKAGAQFPPIEIDQNFRIIDGRHRADAFRAAGLLRIPAIVKRMASDQEFFAAAVYANRAHGTRFTSYDRSRITATAEALGIEKERIADMLAVTIEKIEEVERGFASSTIADGPVALKASVRHLTGKRLTRRQSEAHVHVGGMTQTFYVNQVLYFIEGDLLDRKNPALMDRLRKLQEELAKLL